LELAVNPAGTALNTADTFAYTLSVSNGGTLNLTGVVLSNPLPAGLYVDWVQYSRGSCDVSDDLIVWTLGNLSTNRAAAITVTATVLGTSTMTNLMVVSDNAGVASASARQVIQVGTSWPQLNIALTNGQVAIALTNQQVVMSWSDPAALFILESTMDVEFDDGWTTVTNAPVIVGDERTVALPATNASQFYRLKKP